MINRRSLRIKAFKNLYSFESCKGANQLMGLDMIEKLFSPDMNSMEIVDKDELNRKKVLAIADFQKFQLGENGDFNFNPEVETELREVLAYVEKQNKADLKRLSNDLLQEAVRVTKGHLLILSILLELAFQNKKLADEKKSLANILGEKAIAKINFSENKVIQKLKSNNELQSSIAENKISWSGNDDQLRDWYKGVLNKDEEFRQYMAKESTGYDEDWEIVDYICRNIIFKNDVFTSFLEDVDLDWSENKPIVRSLVLKSVKSVKEVDEEFQIAKISYNWEDDSEYVKELFKITVQEDKYLESLLKGKLQNWDIERVAMTDRVLLKMALAEMIYFPSIPKKVTINEFIEISKTFSTPKSKKFVNGILDGLSQELSEKGVIKKSGRGLIDNK